MDDYIAKPIRKKEFLKKVENWTEAGIDTTTKKDESPKEEELVDKTNPQLTPMDFDRAVEEFEGDEASVIEVMEVFIKKALTQVVTIQQALQKGDAQIVMREAHAIKGGAANMTADALADMSFKLEKIGKSGSVKGGLEVLENIEKEICRLKNYVEIVRKS